MEKKKIKLWKKILILVLLLLFILIIFISRKVIILSNIDNKITEHENNNKNIYSKTSFYFNDYTSVLERFIKDGVDKIVLEKTDSDGTKTKIIQITYPNERKLFTEFADNKVMNIYKEEAPVRGSHIENSTTRSYTTIMNPAYTMSLPETILNSLVTKIKSVEVDGKDCYELSSIYNTTLFYSQNATRVSVYVEKNTWLPVKMIEERKEDKQLIKNITTYEYKFNVVTEEDIKEPDNDEYKLAK